MPDMNASKTDEIKLRRVRSFVRRQGRMTAAQRDILKLHWQKYGIDNAPSVIDLDSCFGRSAAKIVEIGFGMGDSLIGMAQAHPELDYLGIEVHRPGVARLLRMLDEREIKNVRVISNDAVDVMAHNLVADSFIAVHLFFPDPWHKTRHHKRRIVDPAFVELITSRLQSGGIFHMATDWENYARSAMAILSDCSSLKNCCGPHNFSPRPDARPLTKFEQRGHRLGHGVWDLIFERHEQRGG